MADQQPVSLVVDDDAIILMDACEILKQAGFDCHDAQSGEDALPILDEHGRTITLLFTDVEMPGEVNGFALARYAAERFPEIEIVVCSGRLTPDDGELPPQASFIPKPFSVSVVHDHLREKLPDGKKPDPLKD